MATVREALGSEADAEARPAGRALPLQTAVSEALALADEIVRAMDPVGPRTAASEPA